MQISNFSLHSPKLQGIDYCIDIAKIENFTILDKNVEIQLVKNNSIQGVKFMNGIFNYFPSGIENSHPNLKVIMINNCSLKEIQQKDFKPFSELIYLEIYKNLIEKIDKDLFEFNLKLEVLLLSCNKIQFIHPMALKKLKNLKHLNLLENSCYNSEWRNFTSTQSAILNLQPNSLDVTCKIHQLDYKLTSLSSQIIEKFDELSEKVFYSQNLILIIISILAFFVAISIYLHCKNTILSTRKSKSNLVDTKPKENVMEELKNIYKTTETIEITNPEISEGSYSIPNDQYVEYEEIYSELAEVTERNEKISTN